MSRPRLLLFSALLLLVLLLALTPLIPRGADDDGIRPSGRSGDDRALALAPEPGRVTPAMRRAIDGVVARGRSLGRLTGKQSTASLVDRLVRCADLDGQTYCLGLGFTDSTESQVHARLVVAARTSGPADGEATGDLDVLGQLARSARLSPVARAKADRAELVRAARSVAKVWVLRHQVQGVPLPAGFLDEHPEALAHGGSGGDRSAGPAADSSMPACNCPSTPTPTPTPTAAPTTVPTTVPTAGPVPDKTIADYPTKAVILDPTLVAEQSRTYWCGPASMQMIAWSWKQEDRGQDYWATKLGTTSSGTAITDMVQVTNGNTGWDNPDRAGKYVVLDIGDFTYEQWLLLNMRHVVDYRAPLIYHPLLLTQYYPYLDHNGSGHYQVGRGYLEREGRPTEVSYFEPWNQQLFHPDEPFISRVQWRDGYKSYRANLAHDAHNIGV